MGRKTPYPETAGDRTRWIRSLRGPRNAVDPEQAYAAFVDQEPSGCGGVVDVACETEEGSIAGRVVFDGCW